MKWTRFFQGRILKIRAVFENEVFVFVCVYAPTAIKDRIVFLDTLFSFAKMY